MKRYIKAAIVQDIYLNDWIANHKDYPYRIVIDDRTQYTGEWETFNDEDYIDCPGVVFIGTYDDLLSGGGDNLLFECEGNLKDYLNRLNEYYIVDENMSEFQGQPELWLNVSTE